MTDGRRRWEARSLSRDAAPVSTVDVDRRGLLARGIGWNAAYQLCETLLAFAAMMVLARVIPPAEYGRFGAVLGVLIVVNSLNFSRFAAHALQSPDGQEPDWSLHWAAGMYIQTALMLLCHGIAGLCWLVGDYRPVAPLLHLAAFGIVLDWPARLCDVMLRREMGFFRLRVLFACSTLLNLGSTIIAGLAGAGAYAIVLGGNVLTPLPFVVDLLLIRRWRPAPGWWRPNWRRYIPSLRFGFQQSGSTLLAAACGGLESVVLPVAVGFAPIGWLSRSRALFGSTVGRAAQVLLETGYPLLPRYAGDPVLYARQATLFLQVSVLLLAPGAIYLGLEGPALSRLVYGDRWIAADPLLWPAALAGLGVGGFSAASAVMLAAGRLRACLVLDAVGAAMSVPLVVVAWTTAEVVTYGWAFGAGQLTLGAIALAAASPRLTVDWARTALVPPAVATLIAAGAVIAADRLAIASGFTARLLFDTAIYFLTLALSLRTLFPCSVAAILRRVPGGERVGGWLRLSLSRVPLETTER